MISQVLNKRVDEAFVALDQANLQAQSELHRLVGPVGDDTREVIKKLSAALDHIESINFKVFGDK